MPTTHPGEAMPLMSARQMLPAARAALEDYLENAQGDLSDTRRLADSVYRAAVDDTMQALRVFSGMEDHLFRGLKHCEEATRLLRGMHAMWGEMGEERDDEEATV